MMDDQVAFGSELRRQRERRNISLASVSDITKINQSLLAALERGDATRWPAGIYRRAFFREYAAAIGLPAESIVAEFARLFPEGGATGGSPRNLLDATSDLRLTLVPQRRWSARSLSLHGCAALLDGSVVFAAAFAAEMFAHLDRWNALGVTAITYYSVSTVCLGSSPGSWLLHALLVQRPKLPQGLFELMPAPRQSAPALIEDIRQAS